MILTNNLLNLDKKYIKKRLNLLIYILSLNKKDKKIGISKAALISLGKNKHIKQ